MSFKDVLGNQRVKNILRKSLQKNRLPHSMLFVGPEGVGKKDTALVAAKAINCLKRGDDACGTCSSCEAITRGNFPDVMIISPLKQVIKIEKMRDLKQTAYLKPMIGKRRVFIVEEAEKMTVEAANSLLKVLEEPPRLCHIFLLTANPYLILPTIKSRCHALTFSRVSMEDVQKVLAENGYDQDQAKIISLLVRGNLRQAKELDWADVQSRRQDAWELFLSFITGQRAAAVLQALTSPRRSLKQDLDQVLEILASLFRDLILLKEGGDPRLLMNPDYRKDLLKVSRSLPLEKALDGLGRVDEGLSGLKRNLNANLLMTSMSASFVEQCHV